MSAVGSVETRPRPDPTGPPEGPSSGADFTTTCYTSTLGNQKPLHPVELYGCQNAPKYRVTHRRRSIDTRPSFLSSQVDRTTPFTGSFSSLPCFLVVDGTTVKTNFFFFSETHAKTRTPPIFYGSFCVFHKSTPVVALHPTLRTLTHLSSCTTIKQDKINHLVH